MSVRQGCLTDLFRLFITWHTPHLTRLTNPYFVSASFAAMAALKNTDALEPGTCYHIFNRAVGAELFFTCEEEYRHFLKLWQNKISPLADTFAYCLMPNHFHFMIRLMPDSALCKELKINKYDYKIIQRRFCGMFSSYALKFNFRHRRMGKLFMLPYRRKPILSEQYYAHLVYYIHRNPLHHGATHDPLKWPYSSYGDIIGNRPTWLHRAAILDWFGGREMFIKAHELLNDIPTMV